VVGEPEVWSPSGSIRLLSSASKLLPYYPRTFLGPDGRVFYAGETVATHYIDPTGTGSWSSVGNRRYGIRDYGAAVMYDEGKILYAGGGRTTNTAEIIVLNSGAPTWQWTGSMVYARRHLNATVLPTGDVLVTGGTGGTAFNDLANAVHAAELWNPTTGTWTVLASNTVNRGYHATSILLPDGRVLHTGSGDGAGAPSERNAELFSPPYLFKGTRPTITAAPSTVVYGTSFSVETPEADVITNVSLIRLGSTTHAADMNQRFQRLSFTRGVGALTITVPASLNRTPPGHYMLFIVDGNGVPSVARIVKVGSVGEPPPPPNAAPVANFTSSCNGLACNFTDTSTDDGSVTGWSWDFGDNGGTSSAQHPGYTFAAEGSYEVTLTVTDNGNKTGTITHTVTLTPPVPNQLPAASFTSACTGLTCTFTDGSTDTDGTVVTWSWSFGDGGTSNARNPGRTYSAAGTYDVTLIVTDDDGGTNQSSATVTVTAPPPPTIALSVTGRTDATKQYMTLRWTGASGSTVDVYRNGPYLTNTANDGIYTNSRNFVGPASYTYKVCQAGSSICSNTATVVF
jgi:PKD repeat protein